MKLARRDHCFLVGKRAEQLELTEAAQAWWILSGYLQGLGDRDVPKFKDLLFGIRQATIISKSKPPRDASTLQPLNPSTAPQ